MKSLLVPIVLSTTVGIGGVVVAPIVTASVTNPSPLMPTEPEAKSFATDDWTTVAYWADKGIDVLHQKYKEECDNNTEYPGTLIGLTKTLTISNKTYSAIVVDEDKDKLSDSENNASLTFHFLNCLEDEQGPLAKRYDGDNNIWETSEIREWLNSEFVLPMEMSLGIELKTVDKVNLMEYGKETTPSITQDKLFLPACNEVSDFSSHSSWYTYFIGESSYYVSEKRARKTIEGGTLIYSLRPDVSSPINPSSSLYMVREDGSSNASGPVSATYRWIVPCFCI